MALIELHPDDVENLPPAEPPRHPLGEVTAIDEHTGLPIVRRASVEHRGTSEPSRGTPVEHSPRASNEGEKHEVKPQSDRPTLHQSTDRAELVRQAKDYAHLFENGLKASTQGIKGARVDSVRDEKSPVRLDEKIQKEGQPVETIPDILAGRIIADSHEAHQKAAKGVHDNFSVVRDIDEFKDGDPDYHYHAHKIQVQVTPQLSAEVHIVPKEIAEAGFDQHADYQRAREADLAGDEKAEKQATAVARKINDEAMRKFEERNAKTPYKFGSTQANVPEDSDAHRAWRAAQAMIDDRDLMGDGKDVDKPHVTVRYGIQGDDTAAIKKYLGQQKPFTAKLGKTTAFPVTPNSDGAAPIIAPVESDDLHQMNAEIEKHGDFKKSDFPDYKPHVTIAYVKPETAHKYVGMDVTAGKKFPVHSVAVSNRNGEHEEVNFTGDAQEGGRGTPERGAGASKGAPDAENGGKMRHGKTEGKIDNASVNRSSASRFAGRREDGSNGRNAQLSEASADDERSSPNASVRGNSSTRMDVREIHGGSTPPPSSGTKQDVDRDGRDDGLGRSAPQIRKGVTVLVGSSHGIVRGGNPNFASGGRWSVETPDGTKTFKGSELTPISPAKPKDGSPWTGVDADRTLFHYDDKWRGPNYVGKPIPAMVDHVKKMLDDGKDVRIFTARVADDPKGIARAAIEAATHSALGRALPVTHEKDRWMESLYDDRAHSVEPNTGKVLA